MLEAPRTGPLFTDLYELTMAAGYYHHNLLSDATFSLFIRESAARNFFVAAGLQEVLDALESFCFTEDDIEYLKQTRLFSGDFLSFLRTLMFTGQLFAMPEGTIFFPEEPVLEVTAPIIEAQLIETFLLNTIGSQVLFASKGARCLHSSKGRPLIDFSLRRTQGQDAGVRVARSTYISGFVGTSNVLAGKRYGIPVSGTMAHSYVSAFDREIDAFHAYAKTFPESCVLLIDTYDTLEGARNAVQVALEMKKAGSALVGVRLDSGNMLALSQQVRHILDDAGLTEVKIYASSGFDEFEIHELLSKGAKIDAFGVGTKVGVSADMPFVDIVYKLVRFGKRNVRKLSSGKMTLAGDKQVFRKFDEKGKFVADIISVRDETIDGSVPLLETVMEKGSRVVDRPSLEEIRAVFQSNFEALPEPYKSIHESHSYPVTLTDRLIRLQPDVATPFVKETS
jgi:nicotinate phosphoribosyltransferase